MTDLGLGSGSVSGGSASPSLQPVVEDNFVYLNGDGINNSGGVSADSAESKAGLEADNIITLSTYEADELYRSQPALFRSEKLVEDQEPLPPPSSRHDNNHQRYSRNDAVSINLVTDNVPESIRVVDGGGDIPAVLGNQDINLYSSAADNNIINDVSDNDVFIDLYTPSLPDNSRLNQYVSTSQAESNLFAPDIPSSEVTYNQEPQYNDNIEEQYNNNNNQEVDQYNQLDQYNNNNNNGDINKVAEEDASIQQASKGTSGIKSNPSIYESNIITDDDTSNNNYYNNNYNNNNGNNNYNNNNFFVAEDKSVETDITPVSDDLRN